MSDHERGEGGQALIEALARTIGIGALAGFAAGVIAGGIGSRLAMRIAAVAAEDRFQGTLTEFEARVGEITGGGTFFLILLGGFVGAFGGLIYLALRRWVADSGPCRGLAFGLLLFAMFGSAIVERDNPDLHLFGPPTLNIAMFASIFMLFGLLVAPIFDLFERRLAPVAQRGGLLIRAGFMFAPFILVPSLGGLGITAGGRAVLLLPYVLLVMPIAAVLLARSAGRFERLSDLRGRWLAMGGALAVLAVPVTLGLILDVQAIADIFSADI